MISIKLAEAEHIDDVSNVLKTRVNPSASENGNITSGDNLSFYFASACDTLKE